jgi:hypothetical protein
MSAGYADRLSKGYNYGDCGQPEIFDNDRKREIGIARLVKLIQESEYIVAHTGAGTNDLFDKVLFMLSNL